VSTAERERRKRWSGALSPSCEERLRRTPYTVRLARHAHAGNGRSRAGGSHQQRCAHSAATVLLLASMSDVGMSDEGEGGNRPRPSTKTQSRRIQLWIGWSRCWPIYQQRMASRVNAPPGVLARRFPVRTSCGEVTNASTRWWPPRCSEDGFVVKVWIRALAAVVRRAGGDSTSF